MKKQALLLSLAAFLLRSAFPFMLLCLTWNLQATTIRYVKPTTAGSGNGSSWANASADLQAMINAAAGGEVWVAAGTGSGSALSITGNAENAYHVVLSVNEAATTVLDGFTVSGGNGNVSGNITVESQSIFRNGGGGMCNFSSSPTITNSIFSGNSTNLWQRDVQQFLLRTQYHQHHFYR